MTSTPPTPPVHAHWGVGSIVSMGLCLGAFVTLAVASGLPLLLAAPPGIALIIWLTQHRRRVAAEVLAAPADPARHTTLLAYVEDAAARLGIPTPQVFVSTDLVNNAFAMSDRGGGAVFFFESTLELFEDDELAAVVAHEVAHLKNRDSLYTIFFDSVRLSLTWLLAIFALLVTAAWLVFAAFFKLLRGTESIVAVFARGTAVLGAVTAHLLTLAGMRSRELSADRTAAKILPDPLALGRALRRLDAAERRWQVGDVPPGIAALCIVQPFVPGLLSRLVASHPSVDYRIRRLESIVGPDGARALNAAAAQRSWERTTLELATTVERLCTAQPHPIDGPVPFEPRRDEALWTVLPGRLTKPRTRSGETHLEIAGSGTVHVTTHRINFVGPEGRTEWQWAKIYSDSWKRGVAGGDVVIMSVANRQRPSGIYFEAQHVGQVERHIRLAMADNRGERDKLVDAARAQLEAHLATRPDLAALHA